MADNYAVAGALQDACISDDICSIIVYEFRFDIQLENIADRY
jgi:hypothetical protein